MSDAIFEKALPVSRSEGPETKVNDLPEISMSEFHELANFLSQSNPAPKKTKQKTFDGLASYLTLPDNVEMLQCEMHTFDEATTMAAIQKIMVEQKRETSLQTLPELSPVALPELSNISDGDCADLAPTSSIGPIHFAKSPQVRRAGYWLIPGLAVFFVNPLFFLVLTLASLCSLLVLSMLSGLSLLLEYGQITARSISAKAGSYLPSAQVRKAASGTAGHSDPELVTSYA